MKFLFPYLILALMAVGCGSEDSSDNDNNTVPPQEETETPGTEPNEIIRWSRIELRSQDAFIDFYDHSLAMDLNRRPVIVTGNFRDDPDYGEGEIKSCTFSITLNESEADRLESEADDLDVCQEEHDDGDVIIDGATNMITLTDRSGNVTEAFKNKYQDLDISQTWLCKGKSSFYSYLKSAIGDKLPDECPPGALKKF